MKNRHEGDIREVHRLHISFCRRNGTGLARRPYSVSYFSAFVIRSLPFIALQLFLIIMTRNSIAQVCPTDPTCDATFGSLIIPPVSQATPPFRLMQSQQESPDGVFEDRVIGLSYNRSWDSEFGFLRDDTLDPSTMFTLESYWDGGSEINWDIIPPNSPSNTALRPFGLAAAYDGSSSYMFLGAGPYFSGASGVQLAGGTASPASLLTIFEGAGRNSPSNTMQIDRLNNTSSFVWRSGGIPHLNFSLQPTSDANAYGDFGVLKFAGQWDNGQPVVEFEYTGLATELLRSYPLTSDVAPRFLLLADGMLQWGSGGSGIDTDLYRSSQGTLKTDGNLLVTGNLAVTGEKSAVVQTVSYGQRALYAEESPESWFEDFGDGKLSGGRKTVRLEPIFLQTVNSSLNYHVFLTPEGKCALYVSKKTTTFFEVKRLSGVRTCDFDYRIVARRKGYESLRLQNVDNPKVLLSVASSVLKR
jgi:hypothetical protein